jgi:uncharacterized damage-inducible protein DinB
MLAEYLRSHWAAVRAGLLETVAKFDDADLDFAPFDGAYSVRRLVLHIAHEEYGEVQHGITQALPSWPEDFDPAAYPSRAALESKLAEVHTETVRLLAALDDSDLAREIEAPWGATAPLADMLRHVIEHEIHHRAELSLILGLLGRPGLDA